MLASSRSGWFCCFKNKSSKTDDTIKQRRGFLDGEGRLVMVVIVGKVLGERKLLWLDVKGVGLGFLFHQRLCFD